MTDQEKATIRAAVEAFEAWQKGLTQPLMQRLIEAMAAIERVVEGAE